MKQGWNAGPELLTQALAVLCREWESDEDLHRLWQAREAADRAGNAPLHRLLGKVLLWTAAQRAGEKRPG